MTVRTSLDLGRAFRIAGTLIGLAAALGACTHTEEAVTSSIPDDYRLRHPIAATATSSASACAAGGSQPCSKDSCPMKSLNGRDLR